MAMTRTPVDEVRVIELYTSGLGYVKTAEELGVGPGVIRRIIREHGVTPLPSGTIARNPVERFLHFVDECDGHWFWTGATTGPYGKFFVPGQNMVWAHRFSYESFVRTIPPSYEVDHLCRVRLCVKPEHLEAVTKAENLRREFANG